MRRLDEIGTLYLHSKLIQDTGTIFLDIENYWKQGFLTRPEYLTAVGTLRRMSTIPIAISAPIAIVMLGFLALQYFSGRVEHTTEKPDTLITINEVQKNAQLEDRIQVFFPGQMPFVEAPTKPETELASNHKNYSKDAPTPEEIAYVNAFKLFLESYLRSRGYIFPKPEELKRFRQLPHYYDKTFIIDENGIVKPSDEGGFDIPVGIPNFSVLYRDSFLH